MDDDERRYPVFGPNAKEFGIQLIAGVAAFTFFMIFLADYWQAAIDWLFCQLGGTCL